MPCGQKVGWDPEEHSAKDINLINKIIHNKNFNNNLNKSFTLY